MTRWLPVLPLLWLPLAADACGAEGLLVKLGPEAMSEAALLPPFGAAGGRTGIASLDRLLASRPDIQVERLLPPVPARGPGGAAAAGLDRWLLLRAGEPDRLAELQTALAALPSVEEVERDGIAHGAGVLPDDPLFSEQWHLWNRNKAGADIHATDAWAISTGSDSLVVAIIDSGIHLTQPDLAPRIWTNPGEIPENALDDDGNGYVDDVHGWNFVASGPDPEDRFGHGTFVAGVLGAESDNGAGIAGVDWHCRLLPLVVLDSDNTARYSEIVRAVVYALGAGARVLNISIGGTAYSAALEEAMWSAHDAGAVVCASMGNENWGTSLYPAACSFVVAVGATDDQDRRAVPFTVGDGSNYGAHLKLVAPGKYIYSAWGSAYGFESGTSFAAPQVSGAVSLLWAVAPSLSNDAVVGVLTSHADDQVGDPAEDTPGFDIYYGYGRLNLARALGAVAPPSQAPTPPALRVSLAPNPAAGEVRVSLSLPRGGSLEVDLFDVAGRFARRLWQGPRGPGPFALDASLARLPGGVYYLRALLRRESGAREAVAARKLLHMR